MSPLSKDPEEWLEQAEYDLKVAESNLKNDFRFYAVFFCHLAVEKALKGLYFKKLGESPPKIHSLTYLLNKIGITAPDELKSFLAKLQEAHVTTRYPEDFKKLQKAFHKELVFQMIKQAKETIQWIKEKF